MMHAVFSGRVPFKRSVSRQRSRATSPLGWSEGGVGEVSHFGSLSQSQRENRTRPLTQCFPAPAYYPPTSSTSPTCLSLHRRCTAAGPEQKHPCSAFKLRRHTHEHCKPKNGAPTADSDAGSRGDPRGAVVIGGGSACVSCAGAQSGLGGGHGNGGDRFLCLFVLCNW